MAKPGGMTAVKTDVPQEVHQMVGNLREKIRGHIGRTTDFKHFEVVEYATQVVAGTNYFVNIKILNNNLVPTPDENGTVVAVAAVNYHLHVRIFRGLDGTFQIVKVLDKYHYDKLKYF
jgi:hypothetical protein